MARAAGLLVLCAAGSVLADDETPDPPPPVDGSTRSLGLADRGRLQNAMRVPDSPLIRIRNERGRYGTSELVAAIVAAAEHVERVHPGARMLLGDLSRESGGRYGSHESHQSGRDADIGFYLVDSRGRPAELDRMVDLSSAGRVEYRERRYRFDKARNWELIASLVSDRRIQVQYVFAMFPVRRLLLMHAEEIGAPDDVVARVRAVMRPDHGNEHRSHFHVRIYCPVADRPECLDEPPFHAWYEGEPPPEEVAEDLAARRRWERRRNAASGTR